jgi:5-formaminoimidazole-4-carboxamide-1-beta-D-ribofuranosyl 5'-monophosphate synthetase
MPRRRARRLLITGVVTSTDLSKSVIEKYVSEAKTRITFWARDYRSSILEYVGDTKRQDVAQAKLTTWYDIYITEVYPKVKETFATARSEYIKRIAKPLGGGVPKPPA